MTLGPPPGSPRVGAVCLHPLLTPAAGPFRALTHTGRVPGCVHPPGWAQEAARSQLGPRGVGGAEDWTTKSFEA